MSLSAENADGGSGRLPLAVAFLPLSARASAPARLMLDYDDRGIQRLTPPAHPDKPAEDAAEDAAEPRAQDQRR